MRRCRSAGRTARSRWPRSCAMPGRSRSRRSAARWASATRSRRSRREPTRRLAGRPRRSAGPDRGGRMTERLGVAIVGGGPAGAALAARLADARPAGRRPRALDPLAVAGRWRVRVAGRAVGPATDRRWMPRCCARSPGRSRRCASRRRGGATFRLTYGADAGGEPAVGFDRSQAGPGPARAGRGAGADIRRGWSVTAVDLDDGRARRPTARRDAGDPPAAVVVGADGPPFGRRAGRRRGPPGTPRSADRADLSPARPGPGRAPRRADAAPARRLCRDRAGRRWPGQHRDRARSRRGGWRSPATAPGPSPTRSSPPSRRPTRTRRAGAGCRRPTSWPAPGRSVTA